MYGQSIDKYKDKYIVLYECMDKTWVKYNDMTEYDKYAKNCVANVKKKKKYIDYRINATYYK